MNGCTWCRESGHEKPDCPHLAVVLQVSAHGIIDPMASEDPQDQLALRILRLRAALRGCLADLHANGLGPSQLTLDLIAGEFTDA